MKSTNLPSCAPRSCRSTDTNTDDFTILSLHNHFQSSYHNIKAWAAHVQATASLPALTIVPPTCHSPYIRNSYSQNTHYLEVSFPIPYETVEDIRRQIAATINKQSPWKTLKGLPHPHKAPLVSGFYLIFVRRLTKHIRRYNIFRMQIRWKGNTAALLNSEIYFGSNSLCSRGRFRLSNMPSCLCRSRSF